MNAAENQLHTVLSEAQVLRETASLRLLLVLYHRSRWPGNATGIVSDVSLLSTGVSLQTMLRSSIQPAFSSHATFLDC